MVDTRGTREQSSHKPIRYATLFVGLIGTNYSHDDKQGGRFVRVKQPRDAMEWFVFKSP